MFGLGAMEILLILVIALIFIGPKKLPDIAKNLGKGIRDFQNALKGMGDEPPPEQRAQKEIPKEEDKNVIQTTATDKTDKSESKQKDES
ncbi:MAG: twin-arginine translocase TatA/TatE family subunit [Halobacteriovoraceae bacterium]|nr:twin-arginine translocase TatA/TatE family subunit [Halobacteriovoraceae bacterium]MCB9095158.1 twin-arginine translocase TatA/TatE family subunit [Halobacteriovoraceae bacterium]